MTETVTLSADHLVRLIISAEDFSDDDDHLRDMAAARLLLIRQAPRAARTLAVFDAIGAPA